MTRRKCNTAMMRKSLSPASGKPKEFCDVLGQFFVKNRPFQNELRLLIRHKMQRVGRFFGPLTPHKKAKLFGECVKLVQTTHPRTAQNLSAHRPFSKPKNPAKKPPGSGKDRNLFRF
jgi:hypothetical protein